MLDDQARAELLTTFRAELVEVSQALTRTFLALEKEPEQIERERLLDEAFRSAHNLKGAARSVALESVEALAHGMEGLLGWAKHGEGMLSPPQFDLLYAIVDFFGAWSSDGGPVGADSLVEDLLHQLATTQEGPLRGVGAPSPPAPAPAQAPAPELRRTELDAPRMPAPPPPVPPAPQTVSTGETIRLPAARLDGLLEQLGELMMPSLEAVEQLAALRALRATLEGWQRDWRSVRPILRQLKREGRITDLRPLVRFLERSDTSLSTLGAELDAVRAGLDSAITRLHGLAEDLQSEVKRLRMVPFGGLAGTLERVVRDVARSQGKEARLILVGADAELDRRVLEELKDPLIHLLRNALDHGIESPAERERLEKPAIGSVVVGAVQRGGAIVIEVEDDGAGLDLGALRCAARARGLVSEAELAAMDDAEAMRLIFRPGLSTRGDVDEISGRGVGLDVVARRVERLGGRVDVQSHLGRGTQFTLTLPLTLVTLRVVLVAAGGALYALPTNAIDRIIRSGGLGSVGGRTSVILDGRPVPVLSLADLVATRGLPTPKSPETEPTLALLSVGTQRVALAIDRVGGEQEVVVKPLGYPLLRVRYVTGATMLGSGRVVPVLHPGDLVRAAARSGPSVVTAPAPRPERPPARVLIVEDSPTTGTLERYILQAAGYQAELARDGMEALTRLHEESFDIIVSDINMPGLDGVTLTEKVRQDPRLCNLPVVLVTSLDSPEDRHRGLQAGADAYIVKGAFDQDHLLRTIRDLV